MTEQELTTQGQSRYDEYMEPTRQEGQGAEFNSTARGDDIEAANTENLRTNAKNEAEHADTESTDPMESVRAKAREAQADKAGKLTRERLLRIAKEVHSASPIQVVSMVEQVKAAVSYARIAIENNLSSDKDSPAYKAANEKLKELSEIKDVWDRLLKYKDQFRGDREQMGSAMRGEADTVAHLAKEVNNFFEHEKIAQPETDPYRPIRSFEELMTKWVDIQEDDRFKPGGQFALIDVEEVTDEFGRTLLKETAHPENFLRWVREKIEFYHDFDPMAPIDLFKNIYIPIGFRTVNLYEMTVDNPIPFNHRIPADTSLQVTEEDMDVAAEMKTFVKTGTGEHTMPDGRIISFYQGYYKVEDPLTGKEVYAYVKYEGGRNRYGTPLYNVSYERVEEDGSKQNISVMAPEEDKDQWNSVHNDRYDKIRERVMYEMWLMTYAHNFDTKYRLEMMPTEGKLKEAYAEICSQNLFTRGRDKLLGILSMPATSRREEITGFMDGGMEEKNKQGSVGKAMQRCLAALYHIAEADASSSQLVGDINPFTEVLKKDGISYRETFSKSLLRQTLEESYKERIPQAARDILEALNEGRSDWDKAELMDILVLGKPEITAELQKFGFPADALERATQKVRAKYQKESSVQSQERLRELSDIEGLSTEQKKTRLFNGLVGRSGITKADVAGNGDVIGTKDGKDILAKSDGYIYAFLNNPGLEDLDSFAQKFFTQVFQSADTAGVNIYAHINYNDRARDRVRKALRDVVRRTEKLDNFEAKYAEEWAFSLSYFTGISARNDTAGIGHDSWSKIINTEAYRLRQTSGGNYYGNLKNLYGIRRLGVNLWEGLLVQPNDGVSGYNKTLYEELVGLTEVRDQNGQVIGVKFDINKDLETFDFQQNAMRQFYADHMTHVIDLFGDLTQKHEFNIDQLMGEDGLGQYAVNHAEMQKLIDGLWKHLRYGYDNRSFLYNNYLSGWWLEEAIDTSEHKEGQIKRTPHFGVKTLRELMFSEKVRSMHMYEREDVSGWAPGQEKTKMARNVFGYLIAMQIREHRDKNSGSKQWSADEISLIAKALMHYSARVIEGPNEIPLILSGFFSPEELHKMLVIGNALLWALFAEEYGEDILGGFLTGLFEALSVILKETGSTIKL